MQKSKIYFHFLIWQWTAWLCTFRVLTFKEQYTLLTYLKSSIILTLLLYNTVIPNHSCSHSLWYQAPSVHRLGEFYLDPCPCFEEERLDVARGRRSPCKRDSRWWSQTWAANCRAASPPVSGFVWPHQQSGNPPLPCLPPSPVQLNTQQCQVTRKTKNIFIILSFHGGHRPGLKFQPANLTKLDTSAI